MQNVPFLNLVFLANIASGAQKLPRALPTWVNQAVIEWTALSEK